MPQEDKARNGLFWRIPPHLQVAASAWASRIVSAVVGIVSIRLLMQGLGGEQYAVYAVLGGLQGWYMLTDMGIGVSLQNHISECRAKEEQYDDFIAVSALIAILLLVFSIALLYLLTPYLAPILLKSFSFVEIDDKKRHFFIVGVLSITACIAGIVYRIWYAEQRGYWANIVPAIASVISLVCVFWIGRVGIDNKLFWSLVAMFAPAAVLPIFVFFHKVRTSFKVRLTSDVLRPLVVRAFKFWFFTLMATGVLQIDYIVMSQFLSAHDIVVYNLTTKIFALVFFVYNALLLAIWPVCAEAIANNHLETVTRYTRRYIVWGTGLIVGATILLSFFMSIVVKLLAPRESIVVPIMFIVLLGGYHAIRVWTDTFAMVLQSMSYLRPFWKFVPLQALVSIVLQCAMVPHWGIYGVVWGLIGSFLLTVAWGLPLVFYRRAREMRKGTAAI